MGANIRRQLLSYLETKEVYELANIDEMSKELREKMKKGRKIESLLNQSKFEALPIDEILEKFRELE